MTASECVGEEEGGGGAPVSYTSHLASFPVVPPSPALSVQELMQEKEDLAAQLQQVRDEVVELRQQLKVAYEGQKQAEASRDEAEITMLEVRMPWGVGETEGAGWGKSSRTCTHRLATTLLLSVLVYIHTCNHNTLSTMLVILQFTLHTCLLYCMIAVMLCIPPLHYV